MSEDHIVEPPNTSSDGAALSQLLEAVDTAVAECPVTKRFLAGDCPKCGATRRQNCGRWVTAVSALEIGVRRTLESKSGNGSTPPSPPEAGGDDIAEARWGLEHLTVYVAMYDAEFALKYEAPVKRALERLASLSTKPSPTPRGEYVPVPAGKFVTNGERPADGSARIIDIAFTAFMRAKRGKNAEDGGPCDWFNDTFPDIVKLIESLASPPSDGVREAVARAIAESQGHDPDELAPRTMICGPNNEYLPWWTYYEEHAEAAILSLLSSDLAGADGR